MVVSDVKIVMISSVYSAVYVGGVNTDREFKPSGSCENGIPDDCLQMSALGKGGSVMRARDALVREVRDFFGGRRPVEQQRRRRRCRQHRQTGRIIQRLREFPRSTRPQVKFLLVLLTCNVRVDL